MEEIVDARDVLDANARTRRCFRARILGHFAPTGPDSWDPYRFVAEPGETIEVLPGLRIQIEPAGAVFRMRREGQVLRVEWQPGNEDGVTADEDPRRRFLRTCVKKQRNAPGVGVKAAIAKVLRR